MIPPLCCYEILWHLLRKSAIAQLSVFNRIYKNSAFNVNMNEKAFAKSAEIKAELAKTGTPIGGSDADVFIAAYCIINDYTLITNNTKEFERIRGLKMDNWKQ